MSEDKEKKATPEAMLADWVKASSEFWTSLTKMSPDSSTAEGGAAKFAEIPKSRIADNWSAMLNIWQAMSLLMSEPEKADKVIKGMQAVPEVFLKLAESGWDAAVEIQRKAMERAGKIGQKTEAYNFDNIDQETFKAWREIYEQEFRQFLNIPQLGLLRSYKERGFRFADSINMFQTTLSELLFLFYLPLEKSQKVLGEKLGEMIKSGKMPDKSKDYYNMWIRVLEGHYMNLYKSPEFLSTLKETLGQLDSLIISKNDFLNDLLINLPIPTNKDMDELYKDFYLLKKRVRELERRLDLTAGDITDESA